MYGRIYTVSFNGVSVSAAQDLFELLASADAALVLHRLTLSQSSEAGDSEDEQLHVSIRRVTGAPTSGSGGSTPTPAPKNEDDTAAAITAEANNTTQLSGGTNTVLHAESFNVRAGLDYFPPPEHRFTFQPSTRCLIELEAAPADAITMSGTVVVEEIK